jgi:hypothetical protein
MANHHFDTEIAERVGVNAAVIYSNISHWCNKNMANNHNFNDGNWWTYNSLEAMCELFPYMTASSIRTALKKLVDEKLVIKGRYNANPYDKTLWYAICQNQQIDMLDDEVRCVENSKCTSAKNSSSSPNIKPYGKNNRNDVLVVLSSGLTHFYEIWGSCKNSLGVPNSSTLEGTKAKWLEYFNKRYWNNHTIDDYDSEVNSICEYAIKIHDSKLSFCPAKNMETGKFFTKKGWKE